MDADRDRAASRDSRPPASVTEPSRLIRPREAAEFLAISPRTLWSLSAGGEIPTIRIRRCIRYLERDLIAWIERRRTPRR